MLKIPPAPVLHASEPWRQDNTFPTSRWILDANAVAVALCINKPESRLGDHNTRRILACVNALAGVPTEDLEAFAVAARSKAITLSVADKEDDDFDAQTYYTVAKDAC
jgi:hypothetical protein